MCCRFLFVAGLVVATSSFGQETGPALERIAFGSCNHEYRPQPLWSAIRQCRPDLWIWLGDIVYGKASNLPDLTRRYQTEKDNPEYKSLREQCRVLGVWDDNDYGVEDGGKNNPNKVECQRLLLDFLDEPADSPRRKQPGVYVAYSFGPAGKRVKIILLDGRYYRDAPGRHADMLGPEQWQWLEQQLTNSDADVHIIGSGIQVIASEHPFEKWANFPLSRQRLFDLLAKTGARNVIFLSGDRHLGEISRLNDPRIALPIYDVTSSGMTHHAKDNFFFNFTHEGNQFRCGNNFVDLNFGLIEFDWEASPPSVKMEIRDVKNVVRVEERMDLAPPRLTSAPR
jgi:alkaline phosphatase D